MQTKRKLFLCAFLDMLVFFAIRGNEVADRAVKEAIDNKPTADLMPFSDLKPLTAKYVYQVWQKQWDEISCTEFY